MSHPPGEGPRRGSSSTLAWLVWAAATAGALMFVIVLGSNVPYWDEWELVPVLTGHQPVTPGFLWSLHNEHRIPLPRVIYLGLFALSHDFRAGMVFNVLALSAAAALLIVVARKARGGGTWTDGFFALVLLNPGHAENMLWSFQIAFVLVPVLLAITMAAIVRLRGAPSRGQAIGIALPMILAPLCGAPGVSLAPVVGGWLGWLALRGPGSQTTRRPAGRILLGGLALACWAVVALYMYRYEGNPGHPKPAGLVGAARGTSEFLSVAFGTAGGWIWPWSAAAVLALVLVTAVAAGVWWWHSREDRLSAEGLLVALAAAAALSLAVGWGRSGFGAGAAMVPRYAALAAPIAIWAYVAWCRLPWPRLGRAVQGACFLAALALYPDNLTAGLEFSHARRAGLQALVKEIRRGVPLVEVARRHTSDVYLDPAGLYERLLMLRQDRLGPFSRGEDEARHRRRFPFLQEPLIETRDGAMTIRSDRVRGRPVIVVHANGDLVFDVHPGLRQVSGFIGLLPAFYAPTGRPGEQPYDGTYYLATFTPDEGEPVVLFSRLLDPQHNPQDRGLVPFQVPLPASGGTLTLSTRFGPPEVAAANGQHDWGFWADIDFR